MANSLYVRGASRIEGWGGLKFLRRFAKMPPGMQTGLLAQVFDEKVLACALRKRINLVPDVCLIDLSTVPPEEVETWEAILEEWGELCEEAPEEKAVEYALVEES